eukprot:3003449-Rhodomonas_salina.6
MQSGDMATLLTDTAVRRVDDSRLEYDWSLRLARVTATHSRQVRKAESELWLGSSEGFRPKQLWCA